MVLNSGRCMWRLRVTVLVLILVLEPLRITYGAQVTPSLTDMPSFRPDGDARTKGVTYFQRAHTIPASRSARDRIRGGQIVANNPGYAGSALSHKQTPSTIDKTVYRGEGPRHNVVPSTHRTRMTGQTVHKTTSWGACLAKWTRPTSTPRQVQIATGCSLFQVRSRPA
ncbi:hypothetical protein BV22DRAFT_422780 [Leucogyrophana mollusca]|uniref:Uncharacterized protein n=1 Tax=Leucogyrophana mollusca TaxID=85980 RepID=A0ACB8BK85_9AGAM|nr:hypothetical protein BV22DRAFT_422780 [Leucogyrophana mollusca]